MLSIIKTDSDAQSSSSNNNWTCPSFKYLGWNTSDGSHPLDLRTNATCRLRIFDDPSNPFNKGYVGIGDFGQNPCSGPVVEPQTLLHLSKNITNGVFQLFNNTNTGSGNTFGFLLGLGGGGSNIDGVIASQSGGISFYTKPSGTSVFPPDPGNGNMRMIIKDVTGFIGIGTPIPSQNLHIAGNVLIDGPTSTLLFGEAVGNPTVGHYGIEYQINDKGLNFWKPYGSFNTSGGQGFQNNILFLNDDGRIGMGVDPAIINAAGYTHKLTVCGSIRATEVVVEAGWCDFVFKKDYKLRSLQEVEAFIKENGHLPEIPKEEDITKKGVPVGEVEAKLLQKVEELTLYVIELNRKNMELEKKIEAVSKNK